MEPMGILGVASSVAGIIDIVGRSLFALHDFKTRFNEANLTLEIMIAELTAIKAALCQTKAWIDDVLAAGQDSTHYFQLMIDLENSLTACHRLVSLMESKITMVQDVGSDSMTFQDKLRTVLSDKETMSHLDRLSHILSALNLVISVSKCRTMSQQETVLHDKQNRELFDRVKDDSSSLVMLYDSTSFSTDRTMTTTTSSKLGLRFPFDLELLGTRPYMKSYRALMRLSRSREAKNPQDQISQEIDLTLQTDMGIQQRGAEVLLFGDIINTFNLLAGVKSFSPFEEFSQDSVTSRQEIFNFVTKAAQDFVYLISEAHDQLMDEEIQAFAENIMAEDPDSQDQIISEPFVQALHEIWQRLKGQSNLMYDWNRSFRSPSPEAASYFFSDISRLGAADFVPNQVDSLVASSIPTTSFTQAELEDETLPITFIKSHQRGEMKKWIHQYEHVASICFIVDVSCFDQQMQLGEKTYSQLQDQLELFSTIVNSRWILPQSVILLFSNVMAFQKKLGTTRFADYFPDYSGGNDYHTALKYILRRFNQQNRKRRNVYWLFLTHWEDMYISLFPPLRSIVQDTMTKSSFIDRGILS